VAQLFGAFVNCGRHSSDDEDDQGVSSTVQ
jgi:hypothetical protein